MPVVARWACQAGAGSASAGAHHAGAQPHAAGAVNPPGSLGPADQRIRQAAPPIRCPLAVARRTRHDQRHGRHQDGGQQARRPHRRPAATLPTGGRRATHDRGRACDCRCADRLRRADLDRARSGRTAAHRHRADPQAPATPTRPLTRIGTRNVGRSGLVNGPFAIEEPVRSPLRRRTLVRRKSSSPPLRKKARAFRATPTDREQRLWGAADLAEPLISTGHR
jgi:hypothetical protein